MSKQHAGIGLLFLVATTGLSILYLLYLLFMPVKTFVVNDFTYEHPIHIETPVVHPGDVIRYQLNYCKFTHVVPTAKSQLIDGQIIPLTPESSPGSGLPIGCHVTEREVMIPDTVNPGRYYLNRELDYRVNSVRTEQVYYYTDYFDVVKRSAPPTSAPNAQSTKDIPVRSGDTKIVSYE